ncbi:hypothetical protein ACIP3A_01890 [Streptomyces tricolor]
MTRTTQTTTPTGPAVPPAVVPAAPRDRAPARRRHRGDAHP